MNLKIGIAFILKRIVEVRIVPIRLLRYEANFQRIIIQEKSTKAFDIL